MNFIIIGIPSIVYPLFTTLPQKISICFFSTFVCLITTHENRHLIIFGNGKRLAYKLHMQRQAQSVACKERLGEQRCG